MKKNIDLGLIGLFIAILTFTLALLSIIRVGSLLYDSLLGVALILSIFYDIKNEDYGFLTFIIFSILFSLYIF